MIRLLSCSLVIDAAHDVCSFWRCVSVSFAPDDRRSIGGSVGVPLLPFDAEREVRTEEVRLGEVEARASIERRPPDVRAGRSRAAEEVDVVILGVDARLFLGAVADAEVHPLMVPLRHGDADGNGVRLQFLVQRLDVRELKQLEAVQPPLRVLHDAALIQLARLERQLPANDVLADALVADDVDRTEVGQRSGFSGEGQRRLPAVAPIVFAGRDLAVREAVILELVHGHLVGADHELPIARLADLERDALFQFVEVRRRDRVEPGKRDRRDEHRLAFGDRNGEIDLVLLVVQLDVEPGDARVGISAVGVKRLNTFQIRVESRPVEEVFFTPRNLRALTGSQRVLETALVHCLHAFKGKAVDFYRSGLLAGGGAGEGEDDQGNCGDRETHGWRHRTITCASSGRDGQRGGMAGGRT